MIGLKSIVDLPGEIGQGRRGGSSDEDDGNDGLLGVDGDDDVLLDRKTPDEEKKEGRCMRYLFDTPTFRTQEGGSETGRTIYSGPNTCSPTTTKVQRQASFPQHEWECRKRRCHPQGV